MLERFVEKDITQCVGLLKVLNESSPLTFNQLQVHLGTSKPRLRKLLEILTAELGNKGALRIEGASVSLNLRSLSQLVALRHQLYQKSQVLRVMAYLIDHQGRSVTEFCQVHYLSETTFYRLQRRCRAFLNLAGLSIKKGYLSGPEYRQRYLIAALSSYYGIDIITKTARDHRLITQLLKGMDPQIEALYQQVPESLARFENLVALTWHRHDRKLCLPKDHLWQAVCQAPLCSRWQGHVLKNLQPYLSFKLNAMDLDYLYLVYLTTANRLFADQAWRDQWYDFGDRLRKLPEIASLTDYFICLFGEQFCQTTTFKMVINDFALKFMGNLQNLIIDRRLDTMPANDNQLLTGQMIKIIVQRWCRQNHWLFPVDPHHLKYLLHQIMPLLAMQAAQTRIYVVTRSFTDGQVIDQLLRHEFGNQIKIQNVGYAKLDRLSRLDWTDGLVIANGEFTPALNRLIDQQACLAITLEDPRKGLWQLREKINKLQSVRYAKMIRQKLSILQSIK